MTIAEETIETVLKLNDVRAEDLYIRAKTEKMSKYSIASLLVYKLSETFAP